MTPLDRQTGIITASGLAFVRNHAGVPVIDPAQHMLLVHGLVRRPMLFSLADIMRFPATSRIGFIECSGNSAPGWQRLGSGVQFSHGLLSCAEWTGVPLRTLLEEAGIESRASWVVAEGADGAAYDRSIPLASTLNEALVVYGQNGEALRPEQGYPLRLILPGCEGSANVKWLHRLKAVERPVYSREETAQYARSNADGTPLLFDLPMPVKSVITEPSPARYVRQRGFIEIRGFAWSGRGRIRGVDVAIDGGKTWRAATLHEPNLPKALVRFTLPIAWDGLALSIASRATDETGDVQPTFDTWRDASHGDLRYHMNAIHSWTVTSEGAVEPSDA